MKANDPFEERLRRQPLRAIPPAWREEILTAARQAARPSPASPARGLGFFAEFVAFCQRLLQPNPRAWAGLAAVWLLILGLNLASREAVAPTGAVLQTASPQVRELLRQQEELFIELAGLAEPVEADKSKSNRPRPQGRSSEEFVNS